MPTTWSKFITTHFTNAGRTLIVEAATTMGKCWLEHPEFTWLKAVPNNEFEALCKRILNLGTLGVKAPVSHTKLEKKTVSF